MAYRDVAIITGVAYRDVPIITGVVDRDVAIIIGVVDRGVVWSGEFSEGRGEDTM